jgi:hypothetical protein
MGQEDSFVLQWKTYNFFYMTEEMEFEDTGSLPG